MTLYSHYPLPLVPCCLDEGNDISCVLWHCPYWRERATTLQVEPRTYEHGCDHTEEHDQVVELKHGPCIGRMYAVPKDKVPDEERRASGTEQEPGSDELKVDQIAETPDPCSYGESDCTEEEQDHSYDEHYHFPYPLYHH